MNELSFEVADVWPERHAAVPTLVFGLRIGSGTETVHSIALRCQIRIEPQRRRYTRAEEELLFELFGETPRWGDTLKPFLWTHVSTMVPGFSNTTEVELEVPCTYDFEVVAAKYLHSLEGGEIPVLLLFSGTIFAKGQTGFQVTQVPWTKEASYRLPVRVWREMMDLYFPGAGWLRLHRETLDALIAFKARRGLPTWDRAVAALLEQAGEDHP